MHGLIISIVPFVSSLFVQTTVQGFRKKRETTRNKDATPWILWFVVHLSTVLRWRAMTSCIRSHDPITNGNVSKGCSMLIVS